jgi:hypothetical protein
MDQVSEAGVEPIAHDSYSALTTAFVLGDRQ